MTRRPAQFSVEILKSLERVQREALLLVTGAYKKTSHKNTLKEVGLPTLSERRQMQKLFFMHKHDRGELPEYLNVLIPNTVLNEINYNLRNKNDICHSFSKKNYLLKSLIPSSIKEWNKQTLDVRTSPSRESLKRKLLQMYSIIANKVFLHGDSHGAINHSRIRMGLSGLNQQRKSYNFINDCSCQLCGNVCEDAMHYLLFCRSYRAHRIELLRDLTLRFPNLLSLN